MRTITRLSVLGVLFGLAVTTTSCSYFHEEAAKKLFNKGAELQKQKSLAEASAAYDELIAKYSQETSNPAILKAVCFGMQNKAIIVHQQGSPQISQALADSMIATCAADSREELRALVAEAMYNKAVAYQKQNQYAQAIETLRRTIATYGKDTLIKTRRTVAAATVDLGYSLAKNRQLAEAENTFRQMISTYAKETDAEIAGQRAMAMYDLGLVLQQRKMFEEAVTSYDQLIASYPTVKGNAYQILVPKALTQQARAYVALKRPADAGKDYIQLIKSFAPGDTPEARAVIANGALRLGEILREQHQMDTAVEVYDDMIRTYSGDDSNEMRAILAEALKDKALALEARSPDEALTVFEQVAKTYGEDRDTSVVWTVGFSLNAAADKHRMIAKREWKNRARALAELHAAQDELKASLVRIPNRSWTLGNLAYVQWLLGDQAAAAQSFASALDDPENGGATIYKDTLGDIARFPIREDAGFRKMIEQEWSKYGTRHPGPGLS